MLQFATAPDGVKLAFEVLSPQAIGEPATVILIHGFGSSRVQNWRSTGWYGALVEAGFAVLAMDCRGHGDSDKPHDPQSYDHQRMAEDVKHVMDAAGLSAGLVIGYSMGGFIGLRLANAFPASVLRLAIAGVGEYYLADHIGSPGRRALLADALLNPQKQSITDPRARMFRDFADQPGKDRIALAACMKGMSSHLPLSTLKAIKRPILVVCGAEDNIAGRPEPLAAVFADAKAVTIPGRDHMSAVGDKRTKQAVIDFFSD